MEVFERRVLSRKTALDRSSQFQHGTHSHCLSGNFRQTMMQTGLLERELFCLLQRDRESEAVRMQCEQVGPQELNQEGAMWMHHRIRM